VAIIGRPNVGKSTLLNVLLKEERAIVSDIEGTTRDSIEDSINLAGINFRFIDTAGIRETADTIENLGIRRTYQKIEQSSIVLLLTEAGDDPILIKHSIEAIRKQTGGGKQLVVVLNKADRVPLEQQKELLENITLQENENIIAISAEKGENIDGLSTLLLEIVSLGSLKHQDVIISNVRHYKALKSASEGLLRVSKGLSSGLPTDLLAQDIREVLHYLGEITGEVTTDEVLGNIFKNFCIGK
jgi:tRNA modification GTPase